MLHLILILLIILHQLRHCLKVKLFPMMEENNQRILSSEKNKSLEKKHKDSEEAIKRVSSS